MDCAKLSIDQLQKVIKLFKKAKNLTRLNENLNAT